MVSFQDVCGLSAVCETDILHFRGGDIPLQAVIALDTLDFRSWTSLIWSVPGTPSVQECL